MKILDKYQTKQITIGFIFIGLVLMSIIWITQSLRIMDMIVTSGISLWAFLKLTFLVLPNFIVIISPIVIFVVCLFTYSRMSVDREIHVLRAIGMSSFRISRPAFLIAFLVTLLSYILVFYFIPNSYSAFRSLQWELRYDLSNLLIKEGEFISLDKNLNLYIKEKDTSGNLLGIMINDNRREGVKSTTLAKQGALIGTSGAPKIIMENGVRQESSLNKGSFSTLHFDSYLIDFDIMEKDATNRLKKAKERPFLELLQLSEKDGYLPKEVRKFRVEAHSRLIKPLYNILFYIIASVGILGSAFNRYGQTKSMLIAIGTMVILQSLQIAFENIASGNLVFLPLLYLNVFIPMLVGFYILKNDSVSSALSKLSSKCKQVFKKKEASNEI